MKLVIELTDKMHQAVKDGTWCGNELWYNALKNATPLEKVLGDIKAEINAPHDFTLGQLESRSNDAILHLAADAFYKGQNFAISVMDKHISGKEEE